MPDCHPYPDMMLDMRPQVETVRAQEDRGTTVIVFTDIDGNWTMVALDRDMQACTLATGSNWMMTPHDPD